MTQTDLNDPALRDRAVRAARGQAPFDVLLTGGTVADTATGEFRVADIGLVGALIASVHPQGSRSDAAEVIDVSGKIIAPGLIDMHMHIESSMITPRRYAEIVVPQGTTTICWDPHEVGNVLGLAGVRWAIDASRNLPLRVLVLAPSCVPSAPGLERAGAVFEAAEMTEMLSWPTASNSLASKGNFSESPNFISNLSPNLRLVIFCCAISNMPCEISTPTIFLGLRIDNASKAKSPVPVATSNISCGLSAFNSLMAFLRQIISMPNDKK